MPASVLPTPFVANAVSLGRAPVHLDGLHHHSRLVPPEATDTMSRPPTSAQLATADITSQNHDRIEPVLPPVPRVTPAQTMVSALAGSLLTSLLGALDL